MTVQKLNTQTRDKYGVWSYEIEFDSDNDEYFVIGYTNNISSITPVIDIIPDFYTFYDGIIDDVVESIEEWLENR